MSPKEALRRDEGPGMALKEAEVIEGVVKVAVGAVTLSEDEVGEEVTAVAEGTAATVLTGRLVEAEEDERAVVDKPKERIWSSE